MYLRKLELKDAPYMLEWMHDYSVVQNLQVDFSKKTIDDCKTFIMDSQNEGICLHKAISDNSDEYLGTVSLKNIDSTNSMAEFAICIRKKAMGKGYSEFAMKEIIRIGFEELDLKHIYWYVSEQNERAIRFYDKQNYKRVDLENLEECNMLLLDDSLLKKNYIWYVVKRNDNL